MSRSRRGRDPIPVGQRGPIPGGPRPRGGIGTACPWGGQGAAVPAANAGSRAPRSALWHFVNSTASAAAPLPAPPGTRWHWLPRLGGNRPRSGRLDGAGAKEGVGASVLRGPASIFSPLLRATRSEEKANSHLGPTGFGVVPAPSRTQGAQDLPRGCRCGAGPRSDAGQPQPLSPMAPRRCHPLALGPERWGAFFVRPPSCTWPRPCEILTRAPVCGTGGEGRAVPAPGQPCRQVLPVFLALLQLPPGSPALPGRPRAVQVSSRSPFGAEAGRGGEASAGFCCRQGSVQEQPLLKQNNLQKYRYSLRPRPDLAKEEQGPCPGQGLAQPHGALGPQDPNL